MLTVDGEDAPTNAGLAVTLADELMELALGMRLAGGSVFRGDVPRNVRARGWVSDNFADEDPQVPRLMRQLLPGFALVSRGDLLIEHLEELRATQPDATTLDALLDFARWHPRRWMPCSISRDGTIPHHCPLPTAIPRWNGQIRSA